MCILVTNWIVSRALVYRNYLKRIQMLDMRPNMFRYSKMPRRIISTTMQCEKVNIYYCNPRHIAKRHWCYLDLQILDVFYMLPFYVVNIFVSIVYRTLLLLLLVFRCALSTSTHSHSNNKQQQQILFPNPLLINIYIHLLDK